MKRPFKNLLKRPRLLMALNLLLGVPLWLLLSSDLTLANNLANYLLPPLIAVFGLISLRNLRRSRQPTDFPRSRLAPILSCLPSITGGVPSILLAIIAILPPVVFVVMLGGMFAVSENLNKTVIQEAPSPDGWKTAEVWFYPVGAYTGGSGRIAVKLRYRYVPLLRREVYNLSNSYEADGESQEYLTWLDNDTIQLAEEEEPLAVGQVDWHLPWFIAVPVEFGSMLPKIATELLREFGPSFPPD